MKMHQNRAAMLLVLAEEHPKKKREITDAANLLLQLARDNARLRSILLANGLIAGPMNDKRRNRLWAKLLAYTSEVTGVSVADLAGRSQKHAIGTPRRIMITAWREVTSDSLANIGRRFDKDHTAIVHSIKVTKEECAIYPDVLELKNKIADYIRGLMEAMNHSTQKGADN